MWENRPILLLVLATAAIMVGTTVTMILPFAWVNTEADRIESVTPCTALQQEGRDVYIREGCNNCHTQTVRPLVPEVLRYGAYSKSGEFVYDRPFLWGSKRTGPDLARIGGKYSDAWHYAHMASPRSVEPKTNMPDYAWLSENPLDAQMIERKMQVLSFPYTAEEIKALSDQNEMDAIVAYMQKLGSDIQWREAAKATILGDLKNPYLDADKATIQSWASIYNNNCAFCHGDKMQGNIGPELIGDDYDDEFLFETIYNGIEGSMQSFSNLGAEKVWKLVNYIRKSPVGIRKSPAGGSE